MVIMADRYKRFMKVKELIEELSKCDPDMDVCYREHIDNFSYPNVDTVGIEYDDNKEKIVVLLIDDVITM